MWGSILKKVKNLIIVVLLLCILWLVGCRVFVNDIVNTSMPFSAGVLSCVSIANGTAIKNTSKADNQLSVVYDNGDVLTYSTDIKAEKLSVSFSMNYVSSEKKSVDFIVELIENILGEEYKGKLTDSVKDELGSAIKNNSSAKIKFTTENCKVKIDFKQTDNVFNLCVECRGQANI